MTTALAPQEPALPLEGGRHHAKTASELCSAALWRRLTDDADGWSDAVRQIARTPALQREIAEVGLEVQARAAKAEAFDILAELIKLAPIYGISERSDDEWALLFGAYIEALESLPIEAIRQGITEWNREGEFFPKPGQIFQRAEPFARKLWKASYRAKKAIAFVETNPPPKTDAERAADRQKLIDEGIMTPDGRIAPLQFRKVETPARPKETPDQMADRLRAIADGTAPVQTETMADAIEEAI